MIAKPFVPRSRKAYLGWLGLVSHEFYHTWNVKRLRPKELGPFDYENRITRGHCGLLKALLLITTI